MRQPAILSIEDWMREGLSGLGYLEGRNLTTDRRRGDSEESLRPAALALVRSKVDVIVAFGTPAACLASTTFSGALPR